MSPSSAARRCWTVADTFINGGGDVNRHAIYEDVHEAMTEALQTVLEMLGLPVEPFGMRGCRWRLASPLRQSRHRPKRATETDPHYPEPDGASRVCCCDCCEGRVLAATDAHPESEWVDYGRCSGDPATHLPQRGTV